MKVTKKIFAVLCIALIAMSTLVLAGCDKKKEDKNTIIGEWAYTSASGSAYVYKFNEDKTGSYSVYGTEMKFTYEDDGKKVSILYNGNTVASDFEYRIEGDKLIIKDSFGKDVEYKRK